VGPVILASLGLGGASFSFFAPLAPYRSFFLVITFVFLGYAFYETYFKGKSSKLNKIVLWSATVLVVIVLTYTYRYTLLNLFSF